MKKRKILISKYVLKKMEHLTKKYDRVENGGLIYGRMNPEWIQINDVSDAGEKAKRTYSGVEFDSGYLSKYTEQKLLEEQFVVGTWHSHPKGHDIVPSAIDRTTMSHLFRYYDETHYPVFIITKFEINKFFFALYKIEKDGSVTNLVDYEVFEEEA
ncbi:MULTISPECIES: Mov34/MPN/PAD-1 family protein [Bacillus cereus group]|uniref:JAB domain-containing protein n=2 Tax=Bacillus cereus group TaxID=86661 RepID=A0A2C1DQJ5_BACCE|nr:MULTISPECIES: Mov34/MPN/PAD-1 family protein [Bacillus cereus group]OFD71175.1 hypothetical protein BWGOE9_52210 [Bacillus mycoides]OFD71846.1 hypothetical protein BWGOE8_51160 [Bacillus mycoides]OFD74799.1 hypothetical protein BWGOE10_51780 [Bacillus mycoides]PGT02338.1 hypothetical protein COD09_12280 [Bacillus cereus]